MTLIAFSIFVLYVLTILIEEGQEYFQRQIPFVLMGFAFFILSLTLYFSKLEVKYYESIVPKEQHYKYRELKLAEKEQE